MENKKQSDTYVVYKHTNKINDKIYVGITCRKPEKRWESNGRGYKSYNITKDGKKYPSHFWGAIQKYGWENFEHKILIHDLTKEQADKWEKKLIKVWDLMNPKKGYNKKEGGSNGRLSEETRLKVGKNNARYYLGKNLPYETIQRIKNKAKKKPVVCIETGIIYESIHEAGRSLNISIPHISTVCKGNTQRKTAGGYHWEYLYEEQKFTPDYIDTKKKKVMCVETGEIFNSIMEASKEKNIERTVISSCINSDNKLLTAGTYHWELLDTKINLW